MACGCTEFNASISAFRAVSLSIEISSSGSSSSCVLAGVVGSSAVEVEGAAAIVARIGWAER